MSRKYLDTDRCPADVELAAFAAHRLAGERNETVLVHIKRCTRCLGRLAAMRRVPTPDDIIRRGSSPWRRLLAWWRRRKQEEA